MSWLNTREIVQWLQSEPGFLGVFPVNKLPGRIPPIPTELKLVVNTDSDNLEGQHWIAILRKSDGHVEIFDSFGQFPSSEVQLWASKHGTHWVHNTKCIQPATSTLCGVYCCMFLMSRHKFNSLNETMHYLSRLV